MKNVFCITSGYGGCCYLRIMLPAFHNGFYIDRPSLMGERMPADKVEQALMRANIVVFHRPEIKQYHALVDLLKKAGKKIVMDNDDTFKIDDCHPLAGFQPGGDYDKILKERAQSVDDFMVKSDLVTTSTEFLAKEYRKISDNVVVLPNCVDPMDWDKPLKNESKEIRIGMVGSVAYEYDYLHIKPLIKKLSVRKDVKFVLFGLGDAKHRKENPKITKAFKDEYNFWDSINKEQIPWCPMHEYQSILNEAKLDIMLIPRKINYFNKCKSNVKFLEAAMVEVPVIAQSFTDGPYETITGDMGVLIKDNADWEREIERLIQDKHLRRKMGVKAKKYTLKHFNIENRWSEWGKEYNKLITN